MPPALQPENAPTSSAPPFRLDQKLHQILYKPEPRTILEPLPEPAVLPEPPYPIHPDPQQRLGGRRRCRGYFPLHRLLLQRSRHAEPSR